MLFGGDGTTVARNSESWIRFSRKQALVFVAQQYTCAYCINYLKTSFAGRGVTAPINHQIWLWMISLSFQR
jgi:hypothetical protein